MVEGGSVFFAGKVTALEVEEFFYNDIDDIFESASIDSDFGGVAVLKRNIDELIFNECHIAI